MSSPTAALTPRSALGNPTEALKRYADWALALGVLGLIVTLVTPVSPIFLDVLLATNISISLLLLLVTMNTKDPVDFSVFPTLLLFATLFRLGLNVASTRLILTGGQAGSIIQAFGNYVTGDNLTVGLVVFLILIIIQFVVITKGSGRISEVAARFVLDAMPGKQMAIDADLNSGLIEADEARSRRAKVASEAEFYGAMDGASKFVRGDAIAGLIITSLNLIGGIAIGTMGGMGLADAGERYSKLTIGDGLVSQIPALFISTAAAILVTKSTSKNSLAFNLMAQVGTRPRSTLIASGMLFSIGLLPDMPKVPFFLLATLLLMTWRSTRHISEDEPLGEMLTSAPAAAGSEAAGAEEEPEKDDVASLLKVDRVSLEIGYRLIPLVHDPGGAGILDHVAQLRRRFAMNEGVLLPPVRIKDNIRLAPSGYRVLVGGQEAAAGNVEAGSYLAMDSGSASGPIDGQQTTDPAFGLPAWWITEAQRDEAEILGYTVIDATSVLVTHLSEVLRGALADLLTRDDIKELIDGVKQSAPAVVEELIPEKVGFGEIQAILKNLLREGVPIRNLPAILEVVADSWTRTKDPEALTELVRQRLGRVLVERHTDRDGTLYAVTLDPSIEVRLAAAVGGPADPEAPPVGPAWLQRLVEEISDRLAAGTKTGQDVVLLVRSNVRRFLGELVQASLPKVAVLSYNEIVQARAVETLGIVTMDE